MGKNKTTRVKNNMKSKGKDRVVKKKKTWKSVKEKRNSSSVIVKSPVVDTPDGRGSKRKDAPKSTSLKSRMMERLNIARFRHLNEESSTSTPLVSLTSFKSYHEGFTQASSSWKTHPLEYITKYIKENIDESKTVADFGCGTAKLRESINHNTYSFDLHALNKHVTQCDVRNTPLDHESVHVVVFCLSLMGCDVTQFISEASRVLTHKGVLIIAETCTKLHNQFIRQIKNCGLKIIHDHTLGDKLFQVLVFQKIKRSIGKINVTLNQTLYKKR